MKEGGPGRRDHPFDSTGLAIQDLGIALGVLDAWRAAASRRRPSPLSMVVRETAYVRHERRSG